MSKERAPPELEKAITAKKAKKEPCDSREGLIVLARLAADGNRYDHMFRYMRRLIAIVAPDGPLTMHERKIFSMSCTILLEGHREAYRYVSKAASESAGVDPQRAEAATEYLELIASEIAKHCTDVVGIIDICFLPADTGPVGSAATPEARVFYKKMKGDFIKYMAEVKDGPEKEKIAQDAFMAYSSAKEDEEQLPATNPTRLELELSLALFYFDIRCLPVAAYSVAKEVRFYFIYIWIKKLN
ncbi:14-3-3 protein 10 [Dendrobium catenatum]|uniref:14-3-3 protein 10 n=1 Tax=Dendrobium catenatum TaxID=906689 RepID=UPI0009F1E418|nr:14-3-3 protein 10 [Dendrobium catenatum]